MTREKTITKSGFPVIIFGIILFITLVLFFGLGVGSLRTYKDIKTFQGQNIRLQALVGIIIHLDEVLTMSARMGAETGNLQWEERYLSFEPQLDAAIKEAERLVPEAFMSKAATQTDVANIKLVTMEKQAFELVRQGQEEAASALLFSDEYDEQKQIYAEGMEQITTSMQNYVKGVVKRHHHHVYITLIAISITLPGLIIAWIYVLRVMRNYIIRRRVAEEELNKLSHAIGCVSKGDYTTKLTSSPVKEIDNIVDGFNRMTQEIRQRENEISAFANILENSLNEIYIFDAKTLRFIHVNKGACLNLGYSVKELSNLTPLDLKPEITAESFAELIEPLRVGKKEKIKFTTVHRRKDGSLYGVEVHLQLSTFQSDPVFVAIVLDITERKKMEETLLQSEKLRAMGMITAGIAHDFNNILAVISGTVQLLEINKEDNKQLMAGLRTIHKVSNDGAQIVRRMRIATRQEDGTSALQPVDIKIVLKQVIEFVKPRWMNIAKAGGINYDIDVDGIMEVPIIMGNESELREVFVNIINNAMDAMEKGGCLSFPTWQSKENIFISISDTGEGMPDEVRRNVFEPFYTTKREKGSGLGLSMSYGIIERHGGDIEVKSEKGKGTTFAAKSWLVWSSVMAETDSPPMPP